MTNYTKEQIENGQLSAQELILSFSTGNNAATKTPSLLKGIHNGAIQGKPVSIAVLTAYAEFMAAKSKELAEALQAGYIVPRHKMQYAVAQAEKPLEGHVMTSAQWVQSCIDKLPPIPEPDYIGAFVLIDTINESMTKSQQWATILEAKALVNVRVYTINDCPTSDIDKFHDLLNKERAIAEATQALSVYLDDVKPAQGKDDAVTGKYYMNKGTLPLLNKMLDEEKWHIVGQPIKVHTRWNADETVILEEEHRIFTIQVINV